MQVESWECDLKVPNLPAATLMPGAALLGQAFGYLLQYTRQTICLNTATLATEEYFFINIFMRHK
jgi:hypothetical protein